MNISKQALEKLKSFEGLRLQSYKAHPSEEYYTIGYGHYSSEVTPGMTITEEQAEKWLLEDLQKFENHVNSQFGSVGLDQHQFDALVDFSYNCGFRTTSTLYKKVKANKNDKSIKDAFMMWNKAGGQVLAGLTRRRQWEADWYFATTPTEEIEDPSTNDENSQESPNDVVSNTINNASGSNSSESNNNFSFTNNSSNSEKLPPKILRALKPTIIVDTLGAS